MNYGNSLLGKVNGQLRPAVSFCCVRLTHIESRLSVISKPPFGDSLTRRSTLFSCAKFRKKFWRNCYVSRPWDNLSKISQAINFRDCTLFCGVVGPRNETRQRRIMIGV